MPLMVSVLRSPKVLHGGLSISSSVYPGRIPEYTELLGHPSTNGCCPAIAHRLYSHINQLYSITGFNAE